MKAGQGESTRVTRCRGDGGTAQTPAGEHYGYVVRLKICRINHYAFLHYQIHLLHHTGEAQVTVIEFL